MKKLFITTLVLAVSFQALSWGQTGHRVVGRIAESHLTKKAKRNLKQIMGNESMAMASTYMDFIRSDKRYKHMAPWHYCTIPDEKNYREAGTPEQGDVIVTINRIIEELASKKFTDKDELLALKMLIHFVGDIHQPLHVGNGEDKGGNDISLTYFGKKTNLHRVWDSAIIDQQGLSFSEYADWINSATSEQIKTWQSSNVLQWALESKKHRIQAYKLPESKRLSYEYNFHNISLVNQRLLQAGIRLAGLLNQIYG